jgi:hypothetical protein
MAERYRNPAEARLVTKLSRQELPLYEDFAREGLEYRRTDPASGNPIVFDRQSGQEMEYPLMDDFKAEGIDPASVIVQYNTPRTALPTSPVDASVRSLYENAGDPRSFADRLRKDFDAVELPTTENGLDGIVVKKNGAWHKVDPGFFEGFSTSELGKDLAEAAPDIALGAAATLAGGKIGGVPGALVGLGGSIVGAPTVKKVFGKVVGTYNPESASQMVSDIALESALNLAGMAVVPGVLGAGKGLLKHVGKPIVKGLDAGTRGALSAAFGRLTRLGSEVIEHLWERPGVATRIVKEAAEVVAADEKGLAAQTAKELAEVAAKQGPEAAKELAQNVVAQRPMKALIGRLQEGVYDLGDKVITAATKTANHIYGKESAEMLGLEGAKKYAARTYDLLDPVFMKMKEAGLGDLDFSAGEGLKFVTKLSARARGANRSFGAEDIRLIRRFGQDLLHWRELGELDGTEGLKVAQQLYKSLNSWKGDFDGASPELRRIIAGEQGLIAQLKADIVNTMSSVPASKAGQGTLADVFVGINRRFADSIDYVNTLRKDLTPGNVMTFVDRMTKAPGEGGGAQMSLQALLPKMNVEGRALHQQLMDHIAALKLAPTAPRIGLASGSLVGGPAATIGYFMGGIPGAAVGATLAYQGSKPATARRILDVFGGTRARTEQFVNWSHDLGEDAAKTLLPYMHQWRTLLLNNATTGQLTSAGAVSGLMGELVKGPAMEEQAKQQLTDWAAKNLGGAK